MRSRTSLFNPGLSKSLLKRFWPLWTVWFWLLIFILPFNISSEIADFTRRGGDNIAVSITTCLLNNGIAMSWYACGVCPFAVLLMFSFLYNSKSSGMIASLPISRESVFVTSYLTGLVPLLLAELIAALVTVAVCGGCEYLDIPFVWKCLWMIAASTVAFYGMASFCAMLTGNAIIVPFACIALGVAPYLAYAGIGSALEALLYGFSFRESELFRRLSPYLGLESIYVNSEYAYRNGVSEVTGKITIENFELLSYYCIAGIVLSVIAFLLYRKRHMESAGDIVAVKVLKPVFKYCLALAGACLLASVMYDVYFRDSFNGASAGVRTIASLVIGAFIGYFAAEMLLEKSLKVFRGNWNGFIIFTAVLLIAAVCCEADIFGFEKYVPDADKVESVTLYYSMDTEYKEPENIEKITELHRQIVNSKKNNELVSSDEDFLSIGYKLKNGKTVSRSYLINRTVNGETSPDLYALEKVINAAEAIKSRVDLPGGLSTEDITYCSIVGYYMDEDGQQVEQHFSLSEKQGVELYESCIVPDAADGHMVRLWPVQDEEYNEKRATLYIQYHFDSHDRSYTKWKEFVLYTDAERCCQWIEENTPLIIQSIGGAREKVFYPVPTQIG